MHVRPVRLLQAVNVLGALVLLLTAIADVAAGEWFQAIVATLLTGLLGEHAVCEAEHAAQQRRVAQRLQQLADDEATPAAAVIDEQLDPARRELAAACCIDSWVSHGKQHDPALCKEHR